MNNIRFLYNTTIEKFLKSDINSIIGIMANNFHGNLMTTTRESWESEISIMKSTLDSVNFNKGQILFEYDIPRLGKRIDIVLLINGIIFCLEFKVGETVIHEEDIDQVLDYALDLRNFHKLSQDKIIAPILIPTNYKLKTQDIKVSAYDDRIINPMMCGENNLIEIINSILAKYPYEKEIDDNWGISPYSPTPTIIEAARTLYNNHSVDNITRHEADKVTTDKTINYILDVIRYSKENNKKSICFHTYAFLG